MKKSIYNDFYSDSIGEATSSFLCKGNKLINNLPKPFVKPNGISEMEDEKEKEIAKDDQSNFTDDYSKVKTEFNSQINSREANCRKLLQTAQKGDKENFLNILEM